VDSGAVWQNTYPAQLSLTRKELLSQLELIDKRRKQLHNEKPPVHPGAESRNTRKTIFLFTA
jgi:hypothetical protein